MKDKLVTLFGGGGFVGRYIVQDLLRAGARVRIADRDPRDSWFLKPLGGLGQTQFIAADVTRPDTVARAVAGADAVVNLVGVFSGNLQKVHVDGARNVAQAAGEAGVEAVVHLSAIGADSTGASVYARTKAGGEQAVRDAFASATILRPSTMFGREDQFINRFARMIASFPIVPVVRGEARFQPAYVADVAQAVVKALADPARFGGRTFELGGPDVFTMAELVRWIARQTGRDRTIAELPDPIGELITFLPGSPISRDQWKLLQSDTVVAADAEGFDALDIAPTPIGAVAPGWLVQYRRNGRFSETDAAA